MNQILEKYFGYKDFKEPQKEIIQHVLQGESVIALLPTGFGKSVTFQVPALLLEGMTIVISPLIALMVDQVLTLKKRGIAAEYLNSSLTKLEQERIYARILKNKIKILYVSPERLQNKEFRKKILKVLVSLVVVDEAHTILWAEDFRTAFASIHDFVKQLQPFPKRMALTATATNQTIEKIKYYLDLQSPKIIQIDFDRRNLYYKVRQIKNKEKFILNYIRQKIGEKGIIYCLTRVRVECLSRELSQMGIKARMYHGGLTNEFKNQNYQDFLEGRAEVMVCTNAFGMGIDIPDIRFVINYDLPQSIEDLVQQMGRASRDGNYGEGVLLFDFSDLKTVEYFIKNIKDKRIKKERVEKLNSVVEYCFSRKCRHQFISNYFGQSLKKCKCFCDNCKK